MLVCDEELFLEIYLSGDRTIAVVKIWVVSGLFVSCHEKNVLVVLVVFFCSRSNNHHVWQKDPYRDTRRREILGPEKKK